MTDDLKQWVLDAAARADVPGVVRQLYADVQREIDQRRPLCVMSGRCCRFDEYGHRLYATTLELAAFVHEWRSLPPSLPAGAAKGCQGGCPFQVGKMCGVHPIRPFGCRIFFCDPSSVDWQQDQYERFHARLKVLHQEMAIPYAYVEWHQALDALGSIVK